MDANPAAAEVDRGDRIAIWAILIVGMFVGGLVAGLGLVNAVFRLLDPSRFPIDLLADIPLETGDGVIDAHGDSLLVWTDQLTAGPLWLLTLGDLAAALAIALVTASLGNVLWRVAQRRPFHRTVQVAALVAGCAVALGSLLAQGLGGLGRMMAAGELNDALGGIALPAFEFQPLLPILGFGILALAYVARAGERLQRDTDGLV